MSLDGKISEFERRALESHLERCADCQRFATSARAFTRVLRETPLEEPTRTASFVAPRCRKIHAPSRLQILAGLATGCSIAFAFVLGSETTHHRSAATPASTSVQAAPLVLDATVSDDSSQVARELRDFSLGRAVRESSLRQRNKPGPQAN